MSGKPTYEELEQRVKAFEKEVLQNKPSEENLLEDEQDRYNKLIQDSNEAIIIAQGVELKLANKAAYRMWGYQNEEEMADLKMSDMVSPKDLEMLLKRGEARERGETAASRYEFRALHKDGTEFLAEVSVSRILYKGQVARQAVIRDITERKKIVEALQESEERLRDFINSATDALVLFDSELNIIKVNEAHMKMFHPEMNKEDLIGINLLDIVPNLKETGRYDDFMQVIHTGTPFYSDDIIPHQKFGNRIISVRAFKLAGGLGTITRDVTEQKMAEKKYKLLADNVTDAICVINLDKFGFEYVSPSVETVSGYTVEEFMDFNIYDLLLPHSADLVMETITNELEKNKSGKAKPQLLELEIIRKDGLKICLGVSARFLRDNEGHVTSILCVARDISERKKVEEELRIERDRSQHYLDIAGVIFIAIDTKQNVTMINQKGCEILGYEEHEIVGKNWFDNFIKAENIEEIKNVFSKVISGDVEPFEYYENPVLSKSGNEKNIAWHNSMVRDESGLTIGILSSGEDITERRQAEEALQKSEKMHRLLAENAKDTIFRQSLPDGGFEYISSAFKSLTGYTPEDLYNEPLLMREIIVHPDSADCFKEQWDKLSDGEISSYYEYKVVSKSGEIKWVNQRSVLIIDNNTKSPIAVEGIISDVTELKKADEKLLREKNSLEEKVIDRTDEIQEKSVALKVLLNQRGDDKKKLEETIMSNVKELLMPNINRLKSSTLTSKQQTAVNVIESNLNEIISPFANSASSIFMKLTPTEIQVANFIKHGASSKDIAESLSLSQRTVDTHRYNIRKKIGVSGKGINLRTYLLSMT